MRKLIYIFLMLLISTFPFVKGNAQTAYPSGTPQGIPGTVQAYKFDNGGEGVAYHKLAAGPATGNPVRTDEAVVIAPIELGSDGLEYAVASTQTGEWLAYTVNVSKTGNYDLTVATSGTGKGKISLYLDSRKLAVVTASNTGTLDLYEDQFTYAYLTKGKHILKVVIDEGGLNFAMIGFAEAEEGSLPVADLLDVIFIETGGANSAIDNSPLHNPIYDVGTNAGVDKVYPTVSRNDDLGINTAHFTAQNQDNTRGSGAYRVDWVDYSPITTNYQNEAPLPLNAIGEAMGKAFSIETMFKMDHHNRNRIYPFSGTQSCGAGFSIDNNNLDDPRIQWYLDTDDKPRGEALGSGKELSVTRDELLEDGVFYHAIGTYYWDEAAQKGRATLYVNGVKIGTSETEEGFNIKYPSTNSTDALAQWFCIGGDSRRADPIVPDIHVNSSYENWAERIFEGEIAVARMYARELTYREALTLYGASMGVEVPATNAYPEGIPHAIPGIVQAYEFDNGGEGEAYHKLTSELAADNPVRSDEAVVIAPVEYGWEGSEYAVASTQAGEWLSYTVKVEKAGIYDITVITSGTGSGKLSLYLDDRRLTVVPASNTSDLNLYDAQYTYAYLPEGQHVLKAVADEGGFNLAMIDFVEREDTGTPVADLLDILFEETGVQDIGPFKVPVLIPNVAPVMEYNETYKGYAAVFSENQEESHRGRCFYQIPYTDLPDYNDIKDLDEAGRTALPDPVLNGLGEGFTRTHTIEALYSAAEGYSERELFSAQQSGGFGLGFENSGEGNNFVFYYVLRDADGMKTDDSKIHFNITEGETVIHPEYNRLYHVVVVVDFDKKIIRPYVDGQPAYFDGQSANTRTFTGTNYRFPSDGNKFARWIALGADAANPDTQLGGKQAAQYSVNGSMLIARVYGRALANDDVIALYNQAKPTAIPTIISLTGKIYSFNNTLHVKDFVAGSTIYVYNLQGQLIRSAELKNGETELSLPSSGVYIVKLLENGKFYSAKILNR